MVKPTLGVKTDEPSVENAFESPTSSISQVGSIPSAASASSAPNWIQQPSAPPTQTPAQIEAYRNLEFRWVMLMQTLKPAGARKQKKVKKIVWEGVPNSVRGRVWTFLTDANARMIPGVFEKLASRAGDRTAIMLKDLERLFPDQPHLRDPNGSLVKLLQAYLSMVPDVQYDRELAMVAGNILSLSPEEDAFWTFVAVMDNQIRLYFALNPIQLDVDSQLFSKAVEWMDPSLAKLLFEQYGVSPHLLCKAWFASIFCSVLPPSHLQRVWDVYLLEGLGFLFRTGLLILQSAKRHLMASPTFPASALSYLTRPPADLFDPDPESFINRVASMRMRDDELKRLRPKIEARLKQTNTPQRPQIVNRDIIKPPTILSVHDTKKALASVS
ncbi:RabGAP/TBC [Dacryopinax primogenitus]|uniref:RabGAP/TBC n=1 Tax=Dacryopinax primogenitus (strain DJM 731) TaxID=1858805 RepID=M5G004_DACPD|nr:RabGAP/TBC [Dacryopinax primogenitus]EJT99136.1 RabGAP/TBC [Dacryopinax primogenitus]